MQIGKNRFNFTLFIFSSFLAFRIIYIIAIPPGQTPDEIFFFERVWFESLSSINSQFVADHVKNFPNNEYFYPPFYFFIVALFIKLTLFFRQLPLNLEDAFLNYAILLRLFMLSFSTGTLIFMWLFIKKLDLPNPVREAVFNFIILVPTFVIFTVSSNPNTLLFFFITIFLYILTSTNLKLSPLKRAASLGIFAGLAMLTKFEGVILVIVPLIYNTFSKKRFGSLFSFWLPFFFSAFLIGGWWYAKNYIQKDWFYDRELFLDSIANNTPPLSFPGYLDRLSRWTFETFFATSGVTNNIHLGVLGYKIILLFLILGILGIIRGGVSDVLKRSVEFRAVYVTLAAVFLLNLFIFMQLNLFLTFQPQGRYLFPSLLFIGLTLVLGFSKFFKKKYLHLMPILVLIIWLFFNWWSLSCITRFFYDLNLTPFWMRCTYYLGII